MARYPAEHKQATRARILAASDRLLKREGVAGASVDAVMRAAGLTVGGFYAHFASKEDLARQALLYSVEQSFARMTQGLERLDDRAFLRTLIERYLEQVDDADLDHACPMTLLLPEVARAGEAFRVEFAMRTAALVRGIEARFPTIAGLTQRETAIAVFSALSGAVAMARAAATPRARKTIARATQAMLCAALGLESDASAQTRRPRRR